MIVKVKSRQLDWALYFLYLISLISVVFAFRAITYLAIAAMLVVSVLKQQQATGKWINKKTWNIFFAGCVVFVLVQCLGVFYSENLGEWWWQIQVKSALLMIPLAVGSSDYLHETVRDRLMKHYIVVLVIFMTWCLAVALYKYYSGSHDSSLFLYHQLVSPFRQHAIMVSIMVFMGIAYLLEKAGKGTYLVNGIVHVAALVYCMFFILLLSSKLVIAFSVAYLCYIFFRMIKRKTVNRWTIAITTFLALVAFIIVLFTRNPISNRFYEIFADDVQMIEQPKFSPANYFNGLQFRLLEWRFVKEIMNENHAWLLGVGPGDGQAALDQKYISTNMYLGKEGTADKGFLGYNTHNQFLQSVLQSGLLGLVAYLIICWGMLQMVVQRKKAELTALTLLLIFYSTNEAVFETQYGIFIFLFFPLFTFYGTEKKRVVS